MLDRLIVEAQLVSQLYDVAQTQNKLLAAYSESAKDVLFGLQWKPSQSPSYMMQLRPQINYLQLIVKALKMFYRLIVEAQLVFQLYDVAQPINKLLAAYSESARDIARNRFGESGENSRKTEPSTSGTEARKDKYINYHQLYILITRNVSCT